MIRHTWTHIERIPTRRATRQAGGMASGALLRQAAGSGGRSGQRVPDEHDLGIFAKTGRGEIGAWVRGFDLFDVAVRCHAQAFDGRDCGIAVAIGCLRDKRGIPRLAVLRRRSADCAPPAAPMYPISSRCCWTRNASRRVWSYARLFSSALPSTGLACCAPAPPFHRGCPSAGLGFAGTAGACARGPYAGGFPTSPPRS